MIDLARLQAPLTDGEIRLEPLTGAHRAGLKAACAEDLAIWDLYLNSWAPEQFDQSFAALLSNPARRPYAILVEGAVAGMTAWINADARHRSVEIGNTYLAPAHRGSGANARIKRLMLDHAFGLGMLRIQFTIDVRNTRSQAAVLKLGAVKEGVLRNHYVTWTGHQRDSAVFSIVAADRHG